MEQPIAATCLNDFIFCPASVYFHRLYDEINVRTYQSAVQINGTSAHETVDNNHYSTERSTITSLNGYCGRYNLICKIDIYDSKTKTIIERKKKIKTIYDGYVFQLFAQYFCLTEMGYEVNNLKLYSMDDNKSYSIDLPSVDVNMFQKFEETISDIINFDLESFIPDNPQKCQNCIYEPACDRTIGEGGDLND